MRIGIMGAGAVGSYFGARLAKAGNDVVFIARGNHFQKIRREGLKVRSIDGDFQIFLKATETPAVAGVCDLILFAVKSQDTEAAARGMEPMMGEDTLVLSLQNGVENEEILSRLLGAKHVLGGLCYVGARIDRPGEVIHSAAGRVVVGEFDGRRTIRLAMVERVFEEAGVPVRVSDDIVLDQWKKLCWNLAFNSLSALTRGTVGELLAHEGCRELVRKAIAEAVAVAVNRGVELPRDFPDRVIAENEIFKDLKTSMLQDVEKGRRLEIDALNGFVCRQGRAAGIETPVNDTIYALVSCLDQVLSK